MLPSVADVSLMRWWGNGALDIDLCLASTAALSVGFAFNLLGIYSFGVNHFVI